MENLSIGAEHSRIFLAIYRFQIRFRFQFVFAFDSALNLAFFAECLWQTEFDVEFVAAVVTLLLLLLFYCLLLLLLLLLY